MLLANTALQSSHGACRLSALCAAGMAFVAQFFVCRVVVANYYWSLMISAVAALDTKPVNPFSSHLGGKLGTCLTQALSAVICNLVLSVRIAIRN